VRQAEIIGVSGKKSGGSAGDQSPEASALAGRRAVMSTGQRQGCKPRPPKKGDCGADPPGREVVMYTRADEPNLSVVRIVDSEMDETEMHFTGVVVEGEHRREHSSNR
jgi:hypothetical protein